MTTPSDGCAWQKLAVCIIASKPGSEELAIEEVAAAVYGLPLAETLLVRLKTAIVEAVLTCIERSFHQSDTPSLIQIGVYTRTTRVAEQQSTGGWGFFLIERMADPVTSTGASSPYLIELYLYHEGEATGHA